MKSSISTKILLVCTVSVGILNLFQLQSVIISCHQNCRNGSSDSNPQDSTTNENNEQVRDTIGWTYSVDALQYLAEKELQLYQLMIELESNLQSKLSKVQSWIDDFEGSSLKSRRQHLKDKASILEEISSHPFMIFRMIRRFVHLKDQVDLGIQRHPEQRIQDHLNDIESESGCELPGVSDLERSIENIIQLRHIYDLDIHDFINGKISTVQTGVGLTMPQVYEVGLAAQAMNAYSEAIAWFNALIERNPTIQTDTGFEINSTILHNHIYQVSQKHDAMYDKLPHKNYNEFEYGFTNKILSSNDQTNKSSPVQLHETLKEAVLNAFPLIEPINKGYIFHSLCTGKLLMSEVERSKLYCYYETKRHPRWVINPLKVEVYSLDPYIVRYYDVINETVIEYLQDSSRAVLRPAEIVYDGNNTSAEENDAIGVDKTRTSMITFLEENNSILDYIASKISAMTGLEVSSSDESDDHAPVAAENIQIASYTLGGWFSAHLDPIVNTNLLDPLEGDRLATFMIYLNNVKLGGNTAFTELGLSIEPIKGSALFWYNLHKNGEVDVRTMHGGCPVLMGQKWISNTWIHSFASFQKRKCSLNPLE